MHSAQRHHPVASYPLQEAKVKAYSEMTNSFNAFYHFAFKCEGQSEDICDALSKAALNVA